MTTATTRRAIKAEIARMRQNEEAQGQWCTCGHSLPTHDVGYTCQFRDCSCLNFKPSNVPATTQAEAHSPLPWKASGNTVWSGRHPIAEATTRYTGTNGEAIANAALIAQAVNAYTTNQQRIAELEAALRRLRDTGSGSLSKFDYQEWVQSIACDALEARAVLNRGGER